MATIVLGVQWGDEGKGKLCDILSSDADICARGTGGRNCGHTVVANGVTYDFHMLPSGLVNPSTTNLIGSGVVLHVPTFFSELATLEQKGLPRVRERLKVSTRCALNLDLHAVADRMREENLGAKKIGTTGQGIGPAYSAKAERSHCVIVADLFEDGGVFEDKIRTLAQVYARTFGRDLIDYDVEEEISKLKEYRSQLLPFCVDDVEFLEEAQKQNKKIMVEGAQSAMLDNTYGTYPFVTSTSTTLGGIMSGLNLNRRKIDAVVGVLKAYTTRVGAGPFPTEQPGEVGTTLRERGHEVGVTTGRPRRCGWLDLVVARYSNAVNAYDVLNVTKLDVLDTLGEIRVAVAYVHPDTRETIATFPASAGLLDRVEVVYKTMKGWNTPTTHTKTFGALPVEAREYVNFIEEFVGVKVRWIGCGPRREDIIVKED
ncbi:Adenylosuccinate synthetase [Phialemonium atrogriseum]|uniref:Adenylosuccinate synthetase n=1 Tax=Phialemonium atrogriseum TaxID=1093897 RepID=A0AAJ0FDR9_9PEZI|nr:Adenylosuccinate synthetase [Phialemonium atrogriseum]KAK1763542.1 Adenylosuccinate synthetase [Phialemonium atrogriseum]